MTAFTDRPLVYIASAYSRPEPVSNTQIAIKVGESVQSTGVVTAVVPHLNLLWHLIAPHSDGYWYSYDLALLARCDALLRVPGESIGADKEVIFANERGIPVFFDESELIRWALARWSEK